MIIYCLGAFFINTRGQSMTVDEKNVEERRPVMERANIMNERVSVIKSVSGKIQCYEDFYCFKHKFKDAIHKNEVGIEQLLKCIKPTTSNCPFSIQSEKEYYCKCPLRVYLIREFNLQSLI